MILASLFFYLFAGVCVASGFMVIASRNPVHSVLYLILAFVNAAGLFVLMGAEFLAMILVVVYVGAVAVLFLFVVMMLDVDFAELRQGFLTYLPFGTVIGVVFLGELLLLIGAWVIGPGIPRTISTPILPLDQVSNTAAIGAVLYTRYIYYFQVAGVVLLIAMIGAIVLTLRDRHASRRQNVGRQTARSVAETLQMVHLEFGAGVAEGDIIRPLPDPADREPEPERVGGVHAHGGHAHHGPEAR